MDCDLYNACRLTEGRTHTHTHTHQLRNQTKPRDIKVLMPDTFKDGEKKSFFFHK